MLLTSRSNCLDANGWFSDECILDKEYTRCDNLLGDCDRDSHRSLHGLPVILIQTGKEQVEKYTINFDRMHYKNR